MPRKKDENYRQPEFEDVIRMAEEDETFFIGQSYEDCAVTTLACKKCGGKSFNVGQGSYITVIKCISCDWQLDIHNG